MGQFEDHLRSGNHSVGRDQSRACTKPTFASYRESESSFSPLDSECPSNELGSGPVWLINPRCTGNESSLDQCPKAERSSHLEAMCADHTSDVCLVCNNSQYQNSGAIFFLSFFIITERFLSS